MLDEPWDGPPREEIAYVPRRWIPPTGLAPPPMQLGPGGWPSTAGRVLNAGNDLRGRPAPGFTASLWLGEPVQTKGRPHIAMVWATYATTSFPALRRLQNTTGQARAGAHRRRRQRADPRQVLARVEQAVGEPARKVLP
jgi:hypothetical protein